jgi:hypothetical protein
METLDAAEEVSQKASVPKLVVMGFLVIWCPYVFVWFVRKPIYPRAFRIAAVTWAVFWCACLVFYIAVGGDRAPTAR